MLDFVLLCSAYECIFVRLCMSGCLLACRGVQRLCLCMLDCVQLVACLHACMCMSYDDA